MCATMEDRKFYSNYHGRSAKETFMGAFQDVEKGKVGFKQYIEERGITPYKQELPEN